jgi:hypothetical protein
LLGPETGGVWSVGTLMSKKSIYTINGGHLAELCLILPKLMTGTKRTAVSDSCVSFAEDWREGLGEGPRSFYD